MAVTANQPIRAQGLGRRLSGLVEADKHLYNGTLAFYLRTSGASEGYVTDDDNSGANDFAGIVVAEVNNVGGSAGDKAVELYVEGAFELSIAAMYQYSVGDKAYASDNYTVTTSASSTTLIGRFRERISATRCVVDISSLPAVP